MKARKKGVFAMKKTRKKYYSALLLAFVFIFVNPLALRADGAQSWYCKREKDHCRPSAEPNMSYIEEENGFFIGHDLNEKVIYLTFDAGYENGNIARILDTLKAHHAEGAFFILENLIRRNPELVERMKNEGHLVCNHTARHKDMTQATKNEFVAELQSLEALVKENTGYEMAKFYRPPRGEYNEQNLAWAQEMGYATVFWSLAYADWDNSKQAAAEKASHLLCQRMHPGAIVLLHPTSKTNAVILKSLIDTWRAEGYTFASINEL